MTRQLVSLLGTGLVQVGALIAVSGGPYSFDSAPLLATAVFVLALLSFLLALTGSWDWAPIPGTLLVLVMTMPLVGLTLGQGFPAPIQEIDLRVWVPLYLGFGLLAISGRSIAERKPKDETARDPKSGILFELYELCATASAILLVCRMIASH